MSVHHIVSILEQAFFPKWLSVLYQWLSAPQPDYDEITKWYLGWKSLIPNSLLANERVRKQMNSALDMMNNSVVAPGAGLKPGDKEQVSFLRVTERRNLEQSARRGQQRESQTQEEAAKQSYQEQAAQHTMDQMDLEGGPSLRDLVSEYAQQHDFPFMPKQGRLHESLPIYGFGKVSKVIDPKSQLLKAFNGERWAPVSLEQLLALARAKQ